MDVEQRILQALQAGAPYPTDFATDDLARRLLKALNQPETSALDLAVLVRQLVRRWTLRDNRTIPVDLTSEVSAQLRSVAAKVGLIEIAPQRWTAVTWSPEWLDPDGRPCDTAALAGTDIGKRFHEDPLVSDPLFEKITNYGHYRTAGQRAACRAAISSPEGATVLCMLPTGSGKTEIALMLSARKKSGVTVIIVPTLALAADFERRFRDLYASMNAKINPNDLYFAWTSNTSDPVKERMRNRITQGQQPIVVTSPESMTRSLRQAMIMAAETGRFRGFVIDEAHLVTQWGRSFRPEFRTLSDFRHDLLQRALNNGHERAVTLLLSATLGAPEMKDLLALFSEPGPCAPIVANALRSEPDIWIARSQSEEERAARVIDCLAHVPRPAILYLTSPKTANQWMTRLKAEGYGRIATVTGETDASERGRVLQGIRAASDDGAAIDLVVATSAFGLGIDYEGIRTVIHACLPETVDRWYQEMGRGGRDGSSCGEYLLTAPEDTSEAESLGVRILTPEKASKRWKHLWKHRKTVGGVHYLDLQSSHGVRQGDYNRLWNAQLVQGLVELRQLNRRLVDVDDLRELLSEDIDTVTDWVAVEVISAEMNIPAFWVEKWDPWRTAESSHSRAALTSMLAVSNGTLRACDGIARAYEPDETLRAAWDAQLVWMTPLGPCGRCPGCRADGVTVRVDPPPRPRQDWAVESPVNDDLRSFVAAARGQYGVAVLVEPTGEDLGDALAAALIKIGVRHVAGEFNTLPDTPLGATLFRDAAPLAPRDLSPLSSFSRFGPSDSVSRHWLSQRVSPRKDPAGHDVFDILMVPEGTRIGGKELGRDILAMSALTALELLRKA